MFPPYDTTDDRAEVKASKIPVHVLRCQRYAGTRHHTRRPRFSLYQLTNQGAVAKWVIAQSEEEAFYYAFSPNAHPGWVATLIPCIFIQGGATVYRTTSQLNGASKLVLASTPHEAAQAAMKAGLLGTLTTIQIAGKWSNVDLIMPDSLMASGAAHLSTTSLSSTAAFMTHAHNNVDLTTSAQHLLPGEFEITGRHYPKGQMNASTVRYRYITRERSTYDVAAKRVRRTHGNTPRAANALYDILEPKGGYPKGRYHYPITPTQADRLHGRWESLRTALTSVGAFTIGWNMEAIYYDAKDRQAADEAGRVIEARLGTPGKGYAGQGKVESKQGVANTTLDDAGRSQFAF